MIRFRILILSDQINDIRNNVNNQFSIASDDSTRLEKRFMKKSKVCQIMWNIINLLHKNIYIRFFSPQNQTQCSSLTSFLWERLELTKIWLRLICMFVQPLGLDIDIYVDESLSTLDIIIDDDDDSHSSLANSLKGE